MYYPKDGILNITNLVTGTTVETNVSYDDLYDISILLEEQIVVATQEGNILLLDSETGSILNKQETGLEMIYSDSAENYSFERVQSNEGLYVAIYRNGEEVAIYKLTK